MAIERNFHKFLYNSVSISAKNNKVAKTVALNYHRLNTSTKEKFFESLLPMYLNFKDSAFENIKFEDKAIVQNSNAKKDFRLKSVRISNVRGIPGAKSSLPYGLDLVNGKNLQNLVLLGSNGSGKSSLFNAIEFIYTHEVAENKLRVENPESLKEDDYFDYLEHFNEVPECEIQTIDGNYSLRNRIFSSQEEINSVFPSTHFISDYDIYKKGQLNYIGDNNETDSFHFLIANSLGLQTYLDFTNALKSLSSYNRIKESNDRKKLISQRDFLLENIGKSKEQIIDKNKKINELKTLEDNSENRSYDRIFEVIANIEKNSFELNLNLDSYDKVFNNYIKSHDKYMGLSVNQSLQAEAQFLTLGLTLINNSENCPLCQESKLSLSEIKHRVENRIAEIKDFESASVELEQSIKQLEIFINENVSTIQSLTIKLVMETKLILNLNEFNILYKLENELIIDLEKIKESFTVFAESISKIISSKELLEQKDNSIYNLINNKENSLINEIKKLPKVIEEFNKVRLEKINKIKEALPTQNKIVTPEQQILILESEIKSLQENASISQLQITNLESNILELSKTIDTIAEIRSQAGEFAKLMEASVSNLVINSFQPIKDSITTILSDYLKDEGITLDIKLKEKPDLNDPELNTTTIVAEIHRKNIAGQIEILSPSKYFNTFRFRLFCTMVSISIVIASRKNTGINLPVVMDDIFYASDYGSKTTFKEFILRIMDIFRKFNYDMPLQFILFTHDELVFSSAMNAVFNFESQKATIVQGENEDWKIPLEDKTIFARLFPANDIDENPTESKMGNYWDLIYKMPTIIDYNIKVYNNA